MGKKKLLITVTALAVAVLLSGCSGDDGTPPPASTPASSGRPVPAPAGRATSYPVAPSASASPLPAIASGQDGYYTFSLTSVRRSGTQGVVVEGTLSSSQQVAMADAFTETGYYTRDLNGDGHVGAVPEFSAVELHVPGDTTTYLPMRDAKGTCSCTTFAWPAGLQKDQPVGVFVYLTAPASATAVDISVHGFPTFHTVRVSQ